MTTDGVRNSLKPLFFMGIGSNGMNVNDSEYSIVVNYWTSRDDGNEYVITESGEASGNAYAALDAYFNPQYTINYIVKDENGATLFTVNDVPASEGQTITTLPEEYQRSLFYEYNTVNVTIEDAVTTIEFTATLKEDAPFQFTADTSAPVWYNLTLSATPNYVTYVADGDQNVQLPTTLTDDETTQWAFIGNPYNGFQLVNKAAGTDLVLGSAKTTGSDNTGGNTYATLQSKGSQVNEVWTAKASTSISGKNGFFLFNTENHALNKRNGTANISYWTGGYDAGSTFVATKVLTDEEKYNELIALLEKYPYGSEVNKFTLTVGGEDKTAEAASLIAALKSAGYSADNMATAQSYLEGTAIYLPQAGFYRIKAVSTGTYVGTAEAVGQNTPHGSLDNAAIFYLGETDEEGKYNMIHYNLGNYMSSANHMPLMEPGTTSENAGKFAFEESHYATPTLGSYRIHDGTSSVIAWTSGYLDRWGVGNHELCEWYLEPVTQLPVTLHESETKEGYSVWIATFSAPVSVVSVEGAEIHKVRDTGSAFFCEPANVQGIPAGKGALLVTNTETATATVTLGETSEDFETILQPLYACEKGKAGLFLGKVEGSQIAGLYPIDSETPTGGFKAFVDDSTGEGKELVFDQDPTGIENMEHGTLNMNNGAIYNLQGQRVNKAQKGVFIQNGKKVVLK